MTLIKYDGDISPCRIVVYDLEFYWNNGEIKDLNNFHATKLVNDNKHFTYVNKEMTTEAISSPIDKMKKDDLLDYTAQNNIKADYTMTKDELKKKVKESKNI